MVKIGFVEIKKKSYQVLITFPNIFFAYFLVSYFHITHIFNLFFCGVVCHLILWSVSHVIGLSYVRQTLKQAKIANCHFFFIFVFRIVHMLPIYIKLLFIKEVDKNFFSTIKLTENGLIEKVLKQNQT